MGNNILPFGLFPSTVLINARTLLTHIKTLTFTYNGHLDNIDPDLGTTKNVNMHIVRQSFGNILEVKFLFKCCRNYIVIFQLHHP
ncbi:hypothetical protein [Gillisia sp. Hel_I_86]|uniref:hypothetical protein n=1 Tax=Gillisia sp. Hel_I_86 TaxID=1249981 RepID=UPI0011A51CFE|nr:hypothetical protein [Gillisia sp. Hel_I_86]